MPDIRQKTAVLDDFNRAGENPLSGGGNWARTDSGLWTPLQLLSNHVTHQAGSNTSQSHWTRQAFDGDVEAWARASGEARPGSAGAWRSSATSGERTRSTATASGSR